MRFLSPQPRVTLTKTFTTPIRNAVATARTCYSSKGIILDDAVGDRERFEPLAKSIYEAGHHTTFQHPHFQFTLEGVSRHFVWGFLHAHPFYNSEQVSQRYVTVKPESAVTPDLGGDLPQRIYAEALELTFDAYQRLSAMLEGPVAADYRRRFPPSDRRAKEQAKTIQKKAQEIARYVLPVATTCYLYHTVSGLTVLRYWRLANSADTPSEQRAILGQMVDLLLAHDPDFEIILQQPIPGEELPENHFLQEQLDAFSSSQAEEFCREFDAHMDGAFSRLIAWQENAPQLVAAGVREVLGLPTSAMSDRDAIALAMDSSRNTLLGESLNLTTLHKTSRALVHAHYTFRKRISHTADSQDQRHRMTPASRPILAAHRRDQPDIIIPALLDHDEAARSLYLETMERLWEKMRRLRSLGVSEEAIQYLLPNAAVIRFTESADLLHLRHKHTMRLCYNAQEEIWRASLDEARAIRDLHPELGCFLLPPCTQRMAARSKPICPEGPRYCGIRVWKQDLAEFERII